MAGGRWARRTPGAEVRGDGTGSVRDLACHRKGAALAVTVMTRDSGQVFKVFTEVRLTAFADGLNSNSKRTACMDQGGLPGFELCSWKKGGAPD